MPVGQVVRALFGRRERQIAAAYRSIYIDLDAYINKVLDWAPGARQILEVGAGEGAMTEQLAAAYPHSEILAIDVTPRVGRLYSGRLERVTFREAPVQDIARERPGTFDLVILSDVIHHVPTAIRTEILEAIRKCLSQSGKLIVKDWARTFTPIHFACWASDRFLTGDEVSYLTPDEANDFIAATFGPEAITAFATIAPWPNNYAMLVDG